MSINGQDTRADLEVKNKRLLGEIDQLQTQLFTKDDQLRQMKEIIEEKRHTQQLAGWAIDRALETLKLRGSAVNPQDVIDCAEKFCTWVRASSAPEVKSAEQETMQ